LHVTFATLFSALEQHVGFWRFINSWIINFLFFFIVHHAPVSLPAIHHLLHWTAITLDLPHLKNHAAHDILMTTSTSGICRKFSWLVWFKVIWCHLHLVWLFVTSQFDVISMFPNQRFGEVCWHNMHIFLHPLPLFCVVALNINYQHSKLAIAEKQTQRYDTAVHNCKNIRLCIKTGVWNTFITTSEQFTTTKIRLHKRLEKKCVGRILKLFHIV